MFERFTDRARRVVVLAQEESRLFNHDYIGTEHILLGLIHEGEGVAATTLESLGISLDSVRSEVEEMIGHGRSPARGHIPFTPRAKKVLELSLREALQLGHTYIGTEHILLGLIREGQGVAAQVLLKLGADLDRVRQQVIDVLSGSEVSPSERERSEGRRYLGLLSESAESLLKAAKGLADDLGHGAIEPVDILLALFATDDDLVRELLATWGIDLEVVRRRIEELASGEEGPDPAAGPGD
jgi:ATP-dependent Clp protease ATP-binding subunit ClpC